ncbi:DUF2793 domain-containing protein [Altericroceibacterium endophyticum]|uniref:DUF2793 domain-containing protein n=1 Tax=Altericroceibacterium endophyticum TaxID=1808508 RepID=A0A6I4T2P3_9SPHN|nr:DUF2793 domain-containing protein [Altericroceibacterium endophyticum]MXO65504.1 DUF2793 domain-containing protein [Altericroceibacterium endophyticum]
MTDAVTFTSTTSRFGLPLLFSGQAEKEFFVNEAFSRLDLLLHMAVEGERASPPELAEEGKSWLVSGQPSGAWEDKPGQIAVRQDGAWMFYAPRNGMRLLDRAAGQVLHYDQDWHRTAPPAVPIGGDTVDMEARATLSALIGALRDAAILPRE